MNDARAEPTGQFGKPPDGMRKHTTSLEPDTMALGTEATPNELFFVCSGSDAPVIEAGDWRLTVGGESAEQAVDLDIAALQELPQRRLPAWLECAGNGRAMFELVGGHTPSTAVVDTQWTLGAMGMADWTGVSLRDVLELAGVRPEAAFVGVRGSDEANVEGEPAAMCLPIGKALDPDTLIAVTMNGEPLSAAHGRPARLVVPGWVGAYWIKWLAHIEVSPSWVPSWRADVYYRERSPDGTDRGPATAHPLKSCLALPWPGQLVAGPQVVTGYARSGASEIDRVEVRIDSDPWFAARHTSDLGRWGWQPFEFEWEAPPGKHVIRTRAWDRNGHTQPESMSYHPNTILWHAIVPHPVVVSES